MLQYTSVSGEQHILMTIAKASVTSRCHRSVYLQRLNGNMQLVVVATWPNTHGVTLTSGTQRVVCSPTLSLVAVTSTMMDSLIRRLYRPISLTTTVCTTWLVMFLNGALMTSTLLLFQL